MSFSNNFGNKIKKKRIWKKTKGRCAHCGKLISNSQQSIDHYIPRYLGGENDDRNLIPLCKKCNKEKGCDTIDIYNYYEYLPDNYIYDCKRYENEKTYLIETAETNNKENLVSLDEKISYFLGASKSKLEKGYY